jgi:hypothetical protein
VVLELELRRRRLEVNLAPVDHPTVQVDAKVALGSRYLLDQLAGDPAASAAEVEHPFVSLGRQVWVDKRARWVIEECGILRPD